MNPSILSMCFAGMEKKACNFIKAFGTQANIRYCPANVNEYLMNLAVKSIKKMSFNLFSIELSPKDLYSNHVSNLSE